MAKDKKTIEDALSRLEKIVQELSADTVSVETGLEKFKEGVTLIKESRQQLQKAENEFQLLRKEIEDVDAVEADLPDD